MKNPIIVYCAGVFDILHIGHLNFLEKAKSYGDILVVGMVSDEGIERYKLKKPVTPFEQRYRIIKSLKIVDYAIKQDDTDPTKTLKKLYKKYHFSPNILIRANDYKGIPPGAVFIKSKGGKLIKIPYTKGISTTLIKQKIMRKMFNYEIKKICMT